MPSSAHKTDIEELEIREQPQEHTEEWQGTQYETKYKEVLKTSTICVEMLVFFLH